MGLFFWSAVSFGQDTINVSVGDYGACPGDNVTVDIHATNFVDVGSISLTLNYDTAVLTCDNIQMKPALNTMYTIFISNATNGQVKISWIYLDMTGGTIGNLGDLDIFEVDFSFKNGFSDLTWDYLVPGNCQFADNLNQDIPATYEHGSLGTPPFSVDVQPQSKTIVDNGNTSFAVTAVGALSYQWKVNTGSGFADVVDGGVYAGATSAQLDITGAPMSMHGYQFACVMTGPCSMTMSTDTVTLNVVSSLTIITNITPATECVGQVVVPVNVTNFNNVSVLNLKLDFDPTILSYAIVTNVHASLAGLSITDNGNHILAYLNTSPPATVGTGLLFELVFDAVPGFSALTWDTITAGACEYQDNAGVPYSATFESGSLTINPLPDQPGTPTGPSNLCLDPANSDYTTTGAANATSYEWMVDPLTAGTVTGTGMTATVNWDNAWTGLATVKVRGMNGCGYGVYSNDLNVTIVSGIPTQPNMPSGTVDICVNAPNTDYTTSIVPEAAAYNWSISPANAGVISGTGTTGTVDWSASFFGTANITVRATNSCGNGIYSNPLTVTVTPKPTTPGAPIGPDSVCTNTVSSDFSTWSVMYATSYIWEVTPASAAVSVTGTDTAATVNWTPGYIGNATVTVKAQNNCGQSTFAGSKVVYIKPTPLQADTPQGPSGMCINSPNSTYTTTALADADSYLWTLSPVSAGNITGNTTSAVVDWDNAYSGDAYVKVKGMNQCGDGAFSDSLHITISTPPIFNIGDDTAMCQGSSITFTGPGGMASYHWSTGATGPSITVVYPGMPSITYYLTVTDAQGCAGVDSVNVAWYTKPTVDLGADYTANWKWTVDIDAGNPGMDFLWSTNETTQVITVDSTGVFGVDGTPLTYSVTVTNVACSTTDDIVITWSSTIGIDEQYIDMDISIAPNPSNGQFKLIVGEVYGEIEMIVLNEMGQLVYSDKINENNSGNYTKEFNLSNLNKGVYFVKLVNESSIKVERIVIR